MDEATITLKGNARKDFSKLRAQFEGLGFTSVSYEKKKLALEKIETSDLSGKSHHFYRATLYPDRLVFTYSLGLNKKKRELEALHTLLNLIKVASGAYEIDASELCAPLEEHLKDELALADSEQYATAQQLAENRERYGSLEKKYKDLVLSSEQNARILLECEKKRDDYYQRIRQLEGISDETLRQEVFKWLKTHAGEISISQFAKAFNIPAARVEEGLEYLLKNGFIRKKA